MQAEGPDVGSILTIWDDVNSRGIPQAATGIRELCKHGYRPVSWSLCRREPRREHELTSDMNRDVREKDRWSGVSEEEPVENTSISSERHFVHTLISMLSHDGITEISPANCDL